ncbi:MAG: SIS domain-containing protein [Deltaproteobacteria bacterium]|nr:SIS domain-containing protein [Deltaproteobacteria bacterium]
MILRDRVFKILAESINLKKQAQKKGDAVVEAAEMIADAFTSGSKLMIFGNGGSAADAQHIAAEFVNRFVIERPPLPAVALTTDTSTLTSIGNDYGFDYVFSKQIKAIGQPGDIAWGISTSGSSPNVLQALSTAQERQIKTIVMTGAESGEAALLADVLLDADSANVPRVQELHITWGHIICELVDYILFQKPSEDGAD